MEPMENPAERERTATLQIGTWTKPSRPSQAGFTLIELVVVLMILGAIALIVIPRVRSFSAGDLERTSRHLSGVILHLTQESASKKEVYRLYFNLDSDDYWVVRVQAIDAENVTLQEHETIKRRHLPEGIAFEDIMTARQGTVTEGEVFAEFHPIGIEAMAIHLIEVEESGRMDARHFTLVANPLTGRVKAFDRYVE
jgi:prepilin-type N-terminal cleavage/methylation domain-containing protein